jgi:hypothetical protein
LSPFTRLFEPSLIEKPLHCIPCGALMFLKILSIDFTSNYKKSRDVRRAKCKMDLI